MSEINLFEKYGLTEIDFSLGAFMRNTGNRLNDAGLSDITEELVAIGSSKQFLAERLTVKERKTIDDSEGPVIARQAAVFQEKVQQVEIVENYDPMMNLEEVAARLALPWSFSEDPYHPASGKWADQLRLFWVRQPLVEYLAKASSRLKRADYGLYFQDCYRPPGVQEGLFRRRLRMIKEEHPEWDTKKTLLEARSKTAYTPRFSSHKAGAAIDLRVKDMRTGELIDIGHEYPDGGAIVGLEFPLVTQSQWVGRVLLRQLSRKAGFSMYPFEDWHICSGDNTAVAMLTSNIEPAVYGPMKSFNLETGEIQEIYTSDELDQIFSEEAA